MSNNPLLNQKKENDKAKEKNYRQSSELFTKLFTVFADSVYSSTLCLSF